MTNVRGRSRCGIGLLLIPAAGSARKRKRGENQQKGNTKPTGDQVPDLNLS
jgi:hypothetical protein